MTDTRDLPARMEKPYLPLICPEAIDFFEDILQPDHVVFEWGSGESTVWLAHRVKYVVSVEGYQKWFDLVTEVLAAEGVRSNVDMLFEPPHGSRKHRSRWNQHADSILAYPDGHFDIIFIDGYHRVRCLNNAMPKLKPGGWLAADDSEWKFFKKALQPLYEKWHHALIRGEKAGRNDDKITVSETAFLQKPEAA